MRLISDRLIGRRSLFLHARGFCNLGPPDGVVGLQQCQLLRRADDRFGTYLAHTLPVLLFATDLLAGKAEITHVIKTHRRSRSAHGFNAISPFAAFPTISR